MQSSPCLGDERKGLCFVGLSLWLMGCSAGYDVQVGFENSATMARAARVEVAIVETCSVQTLGAAPASAARTVAFLVGEDSPSLGDVEAGSYGLYARASDAGCNVVAAGCTPVVLGSRGSGRLRVVVSDVDTPLCDPSARCASNECVGPGADGGAEDAVSSDGGVDARVVDAGGDARAADGAVGDGGTVDAAADVGVTRTYCEQLSSDWGYRYCRDFDDVEEEPFAFGWDRRVMDEGGDQLEDTNAYSGPNAFLARVPRVPERDTCVNAYSEVDVDGRTTGTRLRARVRLGSMDGTEPFVGGYMRLRFVDDVEQCSLVIYSNGPSGGGIVEHSEAGAVDHPFTVRFPEAFEWAFVELDVDKETQTFDVTVDGDTVFSETQVLSAACAPRTGEVIVSIGLQCGEEVPVGSGEVRLDDVNM